MANALYDKIAKVGCDAIRREYKSLLRRENTLIRDIVTLGTKASGQRDDFYLSLHGVAIVSKIVLLIQDDVPDVPVKLNPVTKDILHDVMGSYNTDDDVYEDEVVVVIRKLVKQYTLRARLANIDSRLKTAFKSIKAICSQIEALEASDDVTESDLESDIFKDLDKPSKCVACNEYH